MSRDTCGLCPEIRHCTAHCTAHQISPDQGCRMLRACIAAPLESTSLQPLLQPIVGDRCVAMAGRRFNQEGSLYQRVSALHRVSR